jgi:hypothetical protein
MLANGSFVHAFKQEEEILEVCSILFHGVVREDSKLHPVDCGSGIFNGITD